MSIFDDDQTESSPPRPGRTKNPFADPDERREPNIDNTVYFEDDEDDGDEPFQPMDNNRNRHLSSSLSNIRDDGPAHQPARQEQHKPSTPVRNPFAADASRKPVADALSAKPQPTPQEKAQQTRPKTPTQSQPAQSHPRRSGAQSRTDHTAKSQIAAPEVSVTRPQVETRPSPTPPPPKFVNHSNNSSLTRLILWTLVSMAVLLSGWNMAQLSAIDKRIDRLSDKTNNMTPPTNSGKEDETDNLETRLARLENNLQALEVQLDREPQSTVGNQQSEQFSSLEKRIDELQKAVTASSKTAAPNAADTTVAATPKTAATPAPEKTGWVINMASLSNRKNADTLASKARALGFDSQVEPYPSQGRTLYRIRAYGYATQSAAEQAAQRLQTAFKLNGMLIRKVR